MELTTKERKLLAFAILYGFDIWGCSLILGRTISETRELLSRAIRG